MKLKYLDEYINDKDGNTYQVLDTSSIDFSKSVKGIKINEFLVIGSTLKRNLKTGQITGIDPIAFATTWKICTNKQKYSKE